ncbi:hypothetical protein HPB52_000176 [Rhipicephalus sanguineus]|uniref:TIL domain-containing protein n=1 Tax=Rhipicephalus sanguineus TaxID=34632 RepID=A0A9D4PEU5_RHISA|nr:hypothetical protein HPB52_000176 [Rhipicephalus sanguineus]
MLQHEQQAGSKGRGGIGPGHSDSDCESSTCSELEVPVHGSPRRDRFCRPLYTPPAVKEELRTCVCKKGYVRNSWEECVPRKMCMRCKFQWQKDFRNCASGCPSTCNRADDIVCQIPCAPGCECPPGWKLHPTFVRMCIRAEKCPTKCPPHSSMQECVSTCEPRCGESPPLKCVTSCGTPSCVCDKGYAEYMRAGVKRCVRRERCAKLLDLAELFRPRRWGDESFGETPLGTDRHLGIDPKGCVSSPVCGALEDPVVGKPQRDWYCWSAFTPAWQLMQFRTCLYK